MRTQLVTRASICIGVLSWAAVLGSLVVTSVQYFWTDYRLYTFYPGFYGFCSIGILIYACYDCRDPDRTDAAWNWIAVACFLVLANVVYGTMQACFVLSVSDPTMIPPYVQRGVYLGLVSAITLPLAFIGPTMLFLTPDFRSLSTGMTRWIYYSLVATLLDVVLFVTLVSLTLGTWNLRF